MIAKTPEFTAVSFAFGVATVVSHGYVAEDDGPMATVAERIEARVRDLSPTVATKTGRRL